jgi:hypothetical protein
MKKQKVTFICVDTFKDEQVISGKSTHTNNKDTWYSKGYIDKNYVPKQEHEGLQSELGNLLSEAKNRIKELETQIKMQEPLKSYEVVYGGYTETVECHNMAHKVNRVYYAMLNDGTEIAHFHDVQSVKEL